MNLGERLLGAVISPVVGAVDVDQVVQRVDVERVLGEVDVDALLQRVDLDALLARVDLDALLARVDLAALLARIDVDAVMDRVDVQALVDRVDVQGTVDRIDIDAVAERLDVAALASRAGIDDIVADATRGVGERLLSLARRQIVALDLIVSGIVARLTRRARPEVPRRHSPTGLVAGAVSRLLAFLVDVAALSVLYGLLVSVVVYLIELFSGNRVDPTVAGGGWPWLVGYALFIGLYQLIGLTVAGSSLGKALLGLRVVGTDGRPLKGRQALVRVVVYPFSFVLGLGLAPIVLARSHRALHDKAAHCEVRYDWGDGPIEDRSPLMVWLRAKAPDTWSVDDERDRPAGRRPAA